MKKETGIERLNRISTKEISGWEKKATWRMSNESWLDFSFKIAINILDALESKNMSQKKLAELVGVTPQQINKIVRGQENLTLETIFKLQKALNIVLLPGARTLMHSLIIRKLRNYSFSYKSNVSTVLATRQYAINSSPGNFSLAYKKPIFTTYKEKNKTDHGELAMAA